MVEISQNFVAFSEYMNFATHRPPNFQTFLRPCHEIVHVNQIPSGDPSMCETSWDKERHKTDEP